MMQLNKQPGGERQQPLKRITIDSPHSGVLSNQLKSTGGDLSKYPHVVRELKFLQEVGSSELGFLWKNIVDAENGVVQPQTNYLFSYLVEDGDKYSGLQFYYSPEQNALLMGTASGKSLSFPVVGTGVGKSLREVMVSGQRGGEVQRRSRWGISFSLHRRKVPADVVNPSEPRRIEDFLVDEISKIDHVKDAFKGYSDEQRRKAIGEVVALGFNRGLEAFGWFVDTSLAFGDLQSRGSSLGGFSYGTAGSVSILDLQQTIIRGKGGEIEKVTNSAIPGHDFRMYEIYGSNALRLIHHSHPSAIGSLEQSAGDMASFANESAHTANTLSLIDNNTMKGRMYFLKDENDRHLFQRPLPELEQEKEELRKKFGHVEYLLKRNPTTGEIRVEGLPDPEKN
ncbi:MAG: hypothetical protein ABH950_00995 [Candidatus Altiarchaeota archaeon]